MRFLSDILAKAGLIVDGAAVFNSSATGQTPASNDNSTNFATTAWVRTFVQPYTLPIASASVLGGVKVGSGLAIDAVTGVLSVSGGSVAIKATQTFTATAGQTVFTIAGGYTPGLIDVFLNGIYLSPGQTTATNGTTVTLNDAASAGDIIDVIITSPISNGSVANTDNLPEGLTNLYYTTARARAAISLTTTGVSGAATYNNATGVFNIPNYQGLVPANGVAGQILAKASATSYDTTWIDNYTSQVKHLVKLGEAMSAGTPVYAPLAQDAGTNMTVMKASNASEGMSSKTMGLIATGGNAGDFVYVFTEGLLEGLNTSTATKGDPVWLGANGTLIFGLVNKPVAPNHLVFLGIVTRSQANNGEIFVKVQNGFELDELHNVLITTPSTGDGLFYETVAGVSLWKNKSIATVLGYTPANAATTITINGTTYDLSANRSWDIAGGVTSFNTRIGAITLTSGDVTTALGYTPANESNYLALTGGSLSGQLSIGNFDGQALKLQAGTATGNTYLRFFNSAGTPRGYMGLFNTGGVDYLLLDSSSTDVTINGASNLYLQTAGANRVSIGSDGAMGFNYPLLGVRSFMFRAISGRPLAVEVAEAGGVHSVYVRPNSSGRHLITSNYLSGGVYLPLSLSGRENDGDFVLNAGNIGIGIFTPVGKVHIVLPTYTNEDADANHAIFGSGTNGYGIKLGYSESSNSGYINVLKSGVAWSTLYLQTGTTVFNIAGSERVRINSSGLTVSNTSNGVNTGVITRDITAARTSNTGVIYLGSDGTRYLYYDSANYQLPGANLYINGTQAVVNSGTWGINITGTAGSETLATVVGRGAVTSGAVTFNGGITISDGNVELYKGQTVDMSNTGVYSTSNYYPVIIGVPNSGATIQIQNNLNSNVPSWATHGGGFTLNLKWETNGSGWGTTAIKRKVYQYHERFTNQRICGGITQMSNSSVEVVWLRGGGIYYFTFSRNLTASPQSSTYSSNYESVSPTSSVVNDVWNAAAGAEVYYAGTIYTDALYTGGGNGYHVSMKPTTGATFNIGQSTGNRGITGPFLNATYDGSANTTSVPMFFNCESFHVFCNYDQKMRIEATYGDMHLRGYIYQGNTSWSDLRMKQNLKQITDPLTKINKLNGYTFEWREWTGYRNTPEIMERINDAGLIAQEVEQVLPEIVDEDLNRNQKSMNYNGMIALHTEGIKELIKQNQELMARIVELETRLS